MRLRVFLPVLAIMFSLGCGSNSTAPGSPNAPRSYSGTASVGDFLSITLDPLAHSLSYTNRSNGDSGSVSYTVNADGTYTFQPNDVLVVGYELPNIGLLIQAAKVGPNHDQPALITAVEKVNNVSLSMFSNQGFNMMQFRTQDGGIESGCVNLDAQGNVSVSDYWPAGLQGGGSFKQKSMPASLFTVDPSGTFMTVTPPGDTGTNYVFGTPAGVFTVDTPQGAIISLKKAASKNFDPANAGTYHAIYYQKTNATFNNQNETGTPSMGNATIIIDANGNVTVQDAQGNTTMTANLTPVADVAYLYGSGELTDPCYGLFTFRQTIPNTSQQDVFVAFMDHAILFGSFKGVLPPDINNPYEYLYGVGLK